MYMCVYNTEYTHHVVVITTVTLMLITISSSAYYYDYCDQYHYYDHD